MTLTSLRRATAAAPHRIAQWTRLSWPATPPPARRRAGERSLAADVVSTARSGGREVLRSGPLQELLRARRPVRIVRTHGEEDAALCPSDLLAGGLAFGNPQANPRARSRGDCTARARLPLALEPQLVAHGAHAGHPAGHLGGADARREGRRIPCQGDDPLLVAMDTAKAGPHPAASASPRVPPCENRWLDGRRRRTLRGGLGGNRPRFRKGSKISDGAGCSAGVPAGRTHIGAKHPIRHQQTMGKSSAQVGLGCRDLGAIGIFAWKDGGLAVPCTGPWAAGGGSSCPTPPSRRSL
jgi:hypothetical protein